MKSDPTLPPRYNTLKLSNCHKLNNLTLQWSDPSAWQQRGSSLSLGFSNFDIDAASIDVTFGEDTTILWIYNDVDNFIEPLFSKGP